MLRVLIVDDEPAIRDTVALALRRAGHETVAVSSVRARGEALQSGRFDAIVADALIPARNCLELVELLQARVPQVPVLAMSGGGYGAEGALPIMKLLGAQATLSKPFAPAELVAVVEAMVGRAG